jgi:hypothetical protein
MREKPYTADEKRVCTFILEITNNAVGCGDDPIGFLIASYRAIMRERDQLRKHIRERNHSDFGTGDG